MKNYKLYPQFNLDEEEGFNEDEIYPMNEDDLGEGYEEFIDDESEFEED